MSINVPRVISTKSVALTSTVLPIESTVINFATSDVNVADEALVSANSSNNAIVAWGTTAPTSSIGHIVSTVTPPLLIRGAYNVQRIHITSATTLAAAATITISKY